MRGERGFGDFSSASPSPPTACVTCDSFSKVRRSAASIPRWTFSPARSNAEVSANTTSFERGAVGSDCDDAEPIPSSCDVDRDDADPVGKRPRFFVGDLVSGRCCDRGESAAIHSAGVSADMFDGVSAEGLACAGKAGEEAEVTWAL